MKLFKILVASLLCFNLSGCLDDLASSDSDTESSVPDSSSSGGSGSGGAGSDSSSSGSYEYTYSCGAGTSPQVIPIPKGNCESQYKTYAKVFGCNDVNNMNSAACGLEKCSGQQMGCGKY